MKVRVKPQYGFGWYAAGSTTAMDVPGEFSFEVTMVDDGVPFQTAFGLVSEPDHPLTGLWIILWQRTRGAEPTYNLEAFDKKPDDPRRPTIVPRLTGFCSCAI